MTLLEELALNAWPAPRTVLLDGWVLRLADGYTRRANSVNPLYAGSQPMEAKIEACEAVYARAAQETVFKLTAAAQPAGLDDALAARGYLHEAATSVQVLDLSTASINPTGPVKLSETLTDGWLADFARLSQLAERHRPALRRILEGLTQLHVFIALEQDDEVIACGLSVLERGYAGLFDIITHPAHRNQGHARRLIANLLAWAREHDAHSAYLQVMLNNAPALNLYEELGFRETYPYWYRVKRG